MVLAGKKGLSGQNYLAVYLFVSLCLELYGHYKIYIQEFDFAYLFNYYSIFLLVFFLSNWFFKVIEQPPLMIFLLSMVLKMLASLTLLLVYLLKKIGPDTEGALVFIFTYVIFEVNEIRRFVSILRPNSGNIK